MMKKLMFFLLAFGLFPHISFAQEDTGLSAEQLAQQQRVERHKAAMEKQKQLFTERDNARRLEASRLITEKAKK